MKNRISTVDRYYKQLENKYTCKMSDELLGIRYSIPKDVGEGTVSRIIIDEGLEIAHWDSSTNMKWSYDNEKNGSNIIEISYCYKGSA